MIQMSNTIQFNCELKFPTTELEEGHIQLRLLNQTHQNTLIIKSDEDITAYDVELDYEDEPWLSFFARKRLVFVINAFNLEVQTPKRLQKLVNQQIHSLEMGNLLVDEQNNPVLLKNGMVPEFVKNSQYKKMKIDHQFLVEVLIGLPILCRQSEVMTFQKVKPMAIQTPEILIKKYHSFNDLKEFKDDNLNPCLDQRSYDDQFWQDAILTNDFHILADQAEPLVQKFIGMTQNLDNWIINEANISHLGVDQSQLIKQL